MENDDNYKEALLRAVITISLMQELVFEFGNEFLLPQKLKSIKPTGSTSMRDAVMTGIKLMLDLNTVLAKLRTNNVWNFVHIVLTDEEDNASKSTLNDSIYVMRRIAQKININSLKTYFIGVDINKNQRALSDLRSLANSGRKMQSF